MKNIAILLAGGSGQRLGNEMPKQFLKIDDKTVMEHIIKTFNENPNIDEICIPCNPNYIDLMNEIVQKNSFDKVKNIIEGGVERYHSVRKALALYHEECNVFIHDAVRFMLSHNIINDCIKALEKYEAITVGFPVYETLIRIDNGFVVDVPHRSGYNLVQTPQCFKLSVIKNAHEIASKDPSFITTDDSAVVKKYLPNVPIFIVNGDEYNFKLTTQNDFYLLERLYEVKKSKE